MTYPNIIGLNGVARAGKDTVGQILHDLYGYEIASFSDVLNQALIALNPLIATADVITDERERLQRTERYAELEAMLGYERAKEYPEVRALLQRLGTEVGRDMLGENIWVEAMFKNYSGQKWAIVNVRFPNEYAAVKAYDGVNWKVERPGFEPAQGHISDRALDGYPFDEVIHNDGTKEELAQKVISLLDSPVQVAFR